MFIEYCKRESIVTDGSVEQYARYASRYLYFLEQTTSKEGEDGEDNNGFIHHISEARFDAFVEWYGKRAEECGYADNDQKTPSSALSHLLRMFLEQDDEEENQMGGGGNLAAEKRRFRESEHLSLEQARGIIRKNYRNDKPRETKETFFNRREGKNSALMKKRVAKRLEKLTLLKSSASVDDVEERKKQIRKTQNLINVNRFNATHNFANLFEALRRCDEAEFGARLLRRAQVEARQTTGRVSDVINPKIVQNELRRVAKALNERVRSESFDNDEARKSFLLRALGDEWPSQ